MEAGQLRYHNAVEAFSIIWLVLAGGSALSGADCLAAEARHASIDFPSLHCCAVQNSWVKL